MDRTNPAYGELIHEITGYIVGYWQDAADGHPYHAMFHPGCTARDMACEYMIERYEDWLEGMSWIDPDRLARYASLGRGNDPVAAAMDACDRMFAVIWPHAEGDDPSYP
ncbi:hypothetical protein [Bifidobacterium avesanii]|uniref:Uncharacterized protein n=1 Tax=Bifidobacterium avesanii TaxID=1798157 RepID=A0A7K3TGY9_9BIFI|nr:hypothetical protein [Bifidobacterium avesanii]KAB8293541.1 hypothetical protein DSM100685_0609 [Bifidobacterium avesanii]NEG78322.1 hypothetical protein [Bifidobacterium avesanii]